MKKLLSLIFFLFIFLINTKAQDQIVNARNINIQVTNPNATGGGAGAVPWNSINVAYVLAPLGPDYGFCMSVVNNNPTSSHTFNVNAFQTGDNGVLDYSHNQGRYAPLTIVGSPSPIAANSTQTFFVRSNGAAKIAFVFSGATTQAGNPDTVDIYAVQTTSPGCGTVNPQTGQQYTLATPNAGTSSATPIMAVSDGLGQAYSMSFSITNPTANELILANTSTTKSLYFDKVVLSCTASCTITLGFATSNGSACGAGAAANLKGNGSPITTATLLSGPCTTNPALAGTLQVDLAANSPFSFDLKGFIGPTSTTTGVQIVNVGSVTGIVRANLFWYEK